MIFFFWHKGRGKFGHVHVRPTVGIMRLTSKNNITINLKAQALR